MNYKSIVKSRKLRIKILRLFNFVPDKLMVKIQYRLSTGKKLNLKKPRRFTEKIQWYKLYYRDNLIKICSDKYSVRTYVESKGLSDILVPLYGVFNNVDEINFNNLPESFVIKSSLGGGNSQVLVIENKNNNDSNKLRETISAWKMKRKYKSVSREWGYESDNPKIIIEENLITKHKKPLIDYKLFCFNGTFKYMYVISERNQKDGPYLDIYDPDFKKINASRPDIMNSNKILNKPINYALMVEIANKLSKDFPHVRVDLYNFDGNIYFGELTFYNGSGYKPYIPSEFDFKVKNFFNLPKKVL